jgi:hypothetical protein
MDRKELQQAALEAQLQLQMQANIALVEKMSSLCINRCVTSTGEKLADRQRRCLDMCTQSFIEGFGVSVRKSALLAAYRRFSRLRPRPITHPLIFRTPPVKRAVGDTAVDSEKTSVGRRQ